MIVRFFHDNTTAQKEFQIYIYAYSIVILLFTTADANKIVRILAWLEHVNSVKKSLHVDSFNGKQKSWACGYCSMAIDLDLSDGGALRRTIIEGVKVVSFAL